MTTFDFRDGTGPVPSHQHPNGCGWVADTAKVDSMVYIGPFAVVYGNAVVSGNAKIYGDAAVYGTATVSGNAKIYGDAAVYGTTTVSGNAQIYGNAQISIMFSVNRSDGYTFTIFNEKKDSKWLEPKITAGCRFFTIKEARNHWEKTRGGTPLGYETLDIIDYLEKRINNSER